MSASDEQVEVVARAICCPSGQCQNDEANRSDLGKYVFERPCSAHSFEVREKARAALSAARPMILEEAAKVAEGVSFALVERAKTMPHVKTDALTAACALIAAAIHAISSGETGGNMSEIELKPCPFCGGGAVVSADGTDYPEIACDACGANVSARAEPGTRAAIAAWNRRPPQEGWRLAAFAKDALGDFWNYTSDDNEGYGIKHGLLVPAIYDPAIHGDIEDSDPGDEIYVYSDWFKAALASIPSPPTERKDEPTNEIDAGV